MIIPLILGPTSLSGHQLKGRRRVRFVFVDESGSSANEPVTVVAGVIVHGDGQWKPVADHLAALVKEHVPTHLQKNFVLHAVDLFSGKALQEAWPPKNSWTLLERVLQTVPQYKLPVSFGFCRKLNAENVVPTTELSGDRTSVVVGRPKHLENPKTRVKIQHSLAMADCLSRADDFIQQCCPDEVGTVLVEDNHEMRKTVKAMPLLLEKISGQAWFKPLRSIVGTINYAGKLEEPLLQMADACAFTLRRKLGGFPHADRFVEALNASIPIERIGDGIAGGSTFAMLNEAERAPFSKSN